MVEALAAGLPATPALAALLLQQAQRFASHAGWLWWLLPLASRVCVGSCPQASAASWLLLAQLAAEVSLPSARALCERGLRLHPFSRQLWQLHCTWQPGEY